MPRDLITEAKLALPAKPIPDLSRPSLEALSWLLRHQAAWEAKHEWDFNIILDDSACGTVGCALGLAWATWGNGNIDAMPCIKEYCTANFDMDWDDTQTIFDNGALSQYESFPVTPTMVADAIDAYLANGRSLP